MTMAVVLTTSLVVSDALPLMTQSAYAAGSPIAKQKPNIVMLMGDDIGWFNLSAYNRGMMGYKTPNIDSIAEDGVLFTDAYGEQSCTAGRAAFITGQLPIRSGMTKVGLPGVPVGLEKDDPTLAELLKPLGYTSGQFGKNHLGDLDEFLPTNHGFDEFYGNLYHLNAEEEPENEDYPLLNDAYEEVGKENPFLPRGVLHSFPDDGTECKSLNAKLNKGESRFIYDPGIEEGDLDSVVSTKPYTPQCIQDTGSLTKKRMEIIDEDVKDRSIQFMKDAEANNQPFFLWFNSTRMHVFTHLKDESQGVTGQGLEADGLVEHDKAIGDLLEYIDSDPARKRNTIVVYTTDNGAEFFTWPDGGTTPFRNEKNTNWDGGSRVPMMVRWTDHIKPGQVSNEIISLLDWVPTFMAAAGNPNIKDQLRCEKLDNVLADPESSEKKISVAKKACLAKQEYVTHLDGYNFLPYLTHLGRPQTKQAGNSTAAPRKEYYYFTDDGFPSGLRYKDWKLIFSEQRAEGFEVWSEPFVNRRVPLVFNLRRDPFEKAYGESDYFSDWRFRRVFLLGPGVLYVSKLLDTFKGYPPRQEPASFTVNKVVNDLLKSLERLANFN